MTISVIDLETTGTDPAVDRIVEIAKLGLVKLPDGSTGKGTALANLVFPGVKIPPEASAVHHIIDADVANKPRIEQVIDHYKGADIYVAHNAEFEEKFLRPYFGPKPIFFCTYKAALRLWPDAPGHSNQVLRYWLGLLEPFGLGRKFNDPHRALSDCYTTGAIFSEIIKRASWPQLMEWNRYPPLQTIIRFGKKHRGSRWDAVPIDYLQWVINAPDMDEEKRFSAQHWFNERRKAA